MKNYDEELQEIKDQVRTWDADHGIDIEAFLEDSFVETDEKDDIYNEIDYESEEN